MRRFWRSTMASVMALALAAGLLVSCPCEVKAATSADHSCCGPVTALRAADRACCLTAAEQAQTRASAPEASPLPTPVLAADRVTIPVVAAWPAQAAATRAVTPSPPKVLRI